MLLTFHKIVAGCEAGQQQEWRTFLSDYSPLMFQLGRLYLPRRQEPAQLWRDVLGALCAGDFKLLRTFEHGSELEFLADLRSFFLERGLLNAGTAEESGNSPLLSPESVSGLLKGLPLLHQEVVLLKLAGYSDRTLEEIFRITPAVAQKSLECLSGDYGRVLQVDQDACPWPVAWLKLVSDARAAKTEACPPLRLFVRIQGGQMGWYEKEPVENHLGQCLRCLEAWTGLREVNYWRTAAPPASHEDLEALISIVPLSPGATKPASLRKRIFG